MITCGEFIDAMGKTVITEAQGFMSEWMALATPEELAEYRLVILTRELVLDFAWDMATFFQQRIMEVDTGVLYTRLVEQGSSFLKEIHTRAVEFEIEVTIEEIVVPLTIVGGLVRAGAAKVTQRKD